MSTPVKDIEAMRAKGRADIHQVCEESFAEAKTSADRGMVDAIRGMALARLEYELAAISLVDSGMPLQFVSRAALAQMASAVVSVSGGDQRELDVFLHSLQNILMPEKQKEAAI